MNKCKCLKCNHQWIQRVNKPKACPKCKSFKWNAKGRKNDKA